MFEDIKKDLLDKYKYSDKKIKDYIFNTISEFEYNPPICDNRNEFIINWIENYIEKYFNDKKNREYKEFKQDNQSTVYMEFKENVKCSFCSKNIELSKDNFIIIVEKRKIDNIEIDKEPQIRFIMHDYCMSKIIENNLSTIDFAINKGNDVY